MATSLNPTTTTQFPVFFPPARHHHPQRPPTEIRFSRWNNANAQKFKTNQKELEDQIRFQKRFDSALTIAHNYNPAPPQPITSPTTTKSTGTPSSPSSPSIPAKKSKYSRQRQQQQHPAFAKPLKKIPVTQKDIIPQNPTDVSIRVDENGVCYELPEAPFVYQYSYTETPKMKPVKLREPLVSPFGAGTMPRPWTGKKPMTKKELPEFDSFRLPPPGKKGVKSIQSPGPFLAGSGPKDVRDREEVLGAPLTKEEVDELVKGCMKTNRQLNIGRDGLTHNMLDNIHALWKRRRVCKIKCKGVCTVDMDNVCKQLEEKTGGKIIYNKGGIVYLFRGRNYNYKYRPRFPLMLWKPVAPVYPRLVQRVPDGLTLEEANEMRRKGRDLTPICKLAKNGLYCDLVKNMREAFEACELVRINCQGLNPSDYKKIGAKLKDLVPCVLMSFENEHILVWRGQDWKSSFDEPLISPTESHKEDVVASPILTSSLKSVPILSNGIEETSPRINDEEPLEVRAENGMPVIKEGSTEAVSASESVDEFNILEFTADHSEAYNQINESIEVEPSSVVSEPVEAQPEKKLDVTNNANEVTKTISPYINGVLLLRNQAVESGMAYVLDDNSLDADIVFRKAVDFAKTAPQGPVFIQRRKQSAAQKTKDETEPKEDKAILGTEITVSDRRIERNTNRNRNSRFSDIKEDYLNVVPQGHLRVDELAKLLA